MMAVISILMTRPLKSWGSTMPTFFFSWLSNQEETKPITMCQTQGQRHYKTRPSQIVKPTLEPTGFLSPTWIIYWWKRGSIPRGPPPQSPGSDSTRHITTPYINSTTPPPPRLVLLSFRQVLVKIGRDRKLGQWIYLYNGYEGHNNFQTNGHTFRTG